jgi:hypothetical protein
MCKCFDWWIVVSNNGKALTIDRLYCGVLCFVEGWSEVAEFAAVSSREKIDHVMLPLKGALRQFYKNWNSTAKDQGQSDNN